METNISNNNNNKQNKTPTHTNHLIFHIQK